MKKVLDYVRFGLNEIKRVVDVVIKVGCRTIVVLVLLNLILGFKFAITTRLSKLMVTLGLTGLPLVILVAAILGTYFLYKKYNLK